MAFIVLSIENGAEEDCGRQFSDDSEHVAYETLSHLYVKHDTFNNVYHLVSGTF